MRPALVAAALIAVSLALASNIAPAFGQSVVITQSVEQTHTIDPAMIEQLPAIEQHASFLTSDGPEQAT